MTIEISEDDKRHSEVMKAMPAFITAGNTSRSQSDYISLELPQQDL